MHLSCKLSGPFLPLQTRSSLLRKIRNLNLNSVTLKFSPKKPSMALTATLINNNPMATTETPPKPKLACFSFAAYAKSLISYLKSLEIPILPGLTDQEFASIESTLHFTFPPDLRSILREGLPVGPSFPNWRSSSPQQLQILLNLPFLSLSKRISLREFWSDSWGPQPETTDAFSLVKQITKNAPVLVPIYRNCYIPSSPNLAGNPVFYIDGEDVRVLSFDVARFFQEVEFLQIGGVVKPIRRRNLCDVRVPAWAATAARRIEFWTDVAERGSGGGGWWRRDGGAHLDLVGCLEEVFWRLKNGGWTEEEVREMMMMDGGDDVKRGR